MYLPVPERVSSTKHLHFGISRIVFAGPGMMVHLQFRFIRMYLLRMEMEE